LIVFNKSNVCFCARRTQVKATIMMLGESKEDLLDGMVKQVMLC